MVSELINQDLMVYNTPLVSSIFSEDVAHQILCIPLSSNVMSDSLCWKLEKKGFFSVKSVYWVASDMVLGDILATSSSRGSFIPL